MPNNCKRTIHLKISIYKKILNNTERNDRNLYKKLALKHDKI